MTANSYMIVAKSERQNGSHENKPLDAIYVLELRYKREANHLCIYCKMCKEGELYKNGDSD